MPAALILPAAPHGSCTPRTCSGVCEGASGSAMFSAACCWRLSAVDATAKVGLCSRPYWKAQLISFPARSLHLLSAKRRGSCCPPEWSRAEFPASKPALRHYVFSTDSFARHPLSKTPFLLRDLHECLSSKY